VKKYEYEYECSVIGNWNGVVRAKNKKHAIEKAKEQLAMENLQATDEIMIYRIKHGLV